MITLITLARMIELYIYTAIAAIPIATLGGGELSSIGKNFLKGFAAVSIQGTIIFIVLNFFGAFVANIPANTLSANNITDVLFQSLLYTFLLVLAVFSSGRFSKSICNAMTLKSNYVTYARVIDKINHLAIFEKDRKSVV